VKLVKVLQPVTKENFEENAYLKANPGVHAAVQRGQFASGLKHFEAFGKNEQRKIFDHQLLTDVRSIRKEKLERIRDKIDISLPHTEIEETGQLDFLTSELKKKFNIEETDNVSGHDYGVEALNVIESNSDGIVLDCGAGLRSTYFSNVVNYEIVPYYSTDISGIGEKLPFLNGTFDAVISIAVLEHVKDPFKCASEIARVLKPGGTLVSAVPFLHEYHGFPHHYYNMTLKGHKNLYDNCIDIQKIHIPPSMWPIRGLQRFLRIYWTDLDRSARKEFEKLSVKTILERDIQDHLQRSYVTELSGESREILAGGSVLIGTKKLKDMA
jgi:SAM-dependent methyltransferase